MFIIRGHVARHDRCTRRELLRQALEQPTRLQILKGESPFSVNYLYRTDSISGACGGNEARYART